MAPARHPAVFGYGSLVNRATHGYDPAIPARLRGWRRVWRQTPLRDRPFLSVEPAEGAIDGLIAAVPGGDWHALDRREEAYLRQPVAAQLLDQTPPWTADVAIYAIDPAHTAVATGPILLSYLDVVVQGFLREFGLPGVARFFASTSGWSRLLDDRHAPLYPRHQPLTPAERRLVDEQADALGLARARA